MVHVKYATDTDTPWKGIGPVDSASETGRLLANVEAGLSNETGTSTGYVIPVPEGSSTDALTTDLRGLKGKLTLAPSLRAGWGEGQQGAPRSEYDPMRLGASPPVSLVSLRSETAYSVLAACGVPPAMLMKSDGTGLRESWRQFLHASVQPVAKVVAVELATKLDSPDLKLTFDALMASDLSGRARAFQSMVGGGMDLNRAAGLSGLMSSDE